MSKALDPSKTPAGRWLLKKRRIALGLYLVFLVAAVVGTQGPWWQVFVGAEPLTDEPKMGNDVDRYSWVETDDPANPAARVEHLLRPAVVGVVLCVVAFFFASYNLVADTDLQVPVLLATVLLAAVSGKVFYDVYADQEEVKAFIEIVEGKRVQAELSAREAAERGDSSPHNDPPARKANDLTLRPKWGLALFLSSSLVMLLDSIYMTFFAERRLAEAT